MLKTELQEGMKRQRRFTDVAREDRATIGKEEGEG